MKKTMVLKVLLIVAFSTLLGSCEILGMIISPFLGISDEKFIRQNQAIQSVDKGRDLERHFLITLERLRDGEQIPPDRLRFVESEIDEAISIYQAALKELPKNNDIKAHLERAQKAKQDWQKELVAAEARRQEQIAQQQRRQQAAAAETERQRQQAAQQQQQQAAEAERQRLAEEERRRLAPTQTSPNSPGDFEIANSSLGGVKITKYKGTRPGVVIPSTIDGMRVTELGDSIFSRRETGITIYSVTLPNSLIAIGYGVFEGQSLSSVSFPSTLRTIGRYAFSGNRLTSVVIPNGVTLVGSYAFAENPITTVVIPPSLANMVGNFSQTMTAGFFMAFYKVDTITRITLPANVNLGNLNYFHDNLEAAYEGNGKRAATFIWTGRIWRVE